MTQTLSAFDIAGAVVATPLAIAAWIWVIRFGHVVMPHPIIPFLGVVAALVAPTVAAFCIARLCGATL